MPNSYNCNNANDSGYEYNHDVARYLDLQQIQCPQALLLVKRRCHQLMPDETLVIDVVQLASAQDIERYLATQPFNVHKMPIKTAQKDSIRFILTPKH